MGILNLLGLKKKSPILLRCTVCYEEYEISHKEARILMSFDPLNPICPLKEECHMCHTGFMIPVNYTDFLGKTYKYHEIKPKIKNLDPNTVMERILNHHETENVSFFGPDD